ncbi:MAG: hypothetical protein ACK52I_29210 [Pseudomonadota bacterium]
MPRGAARTRVPHRRRVGHRDPLPVQRIVAGAHHDQIARVAGPSVGRACPPPLGFR